VTFQFTERSFLLQWHSVWNYYRVPLRGYWSAMCLELTMWRSFQSNWVTSTALECSRLHLS